MYLLPLYKSYKICTDCHDPLQSVRIANGKNASNLWDSDQKLHPEAQQEADLLPITKNSKGNESDQSRVAATWRVKQCSSTQSGDPCTDMLHSRRLTVTADQEKGSGNLGMMQTRLEPASTRCPLGSRSPLCASRGKMGMAGYNRSTSFIAMLRYSNLSRSAAIGARPPMSHPSVLISR
jgi:hypothetical protein